MKETIVSLKTAKLAKKKKFNLFCTAWYGCDDPQEGEPNKLFERDYAQYGTLWNTNLQKGTWIYEAPTLSILQQWLREKHNIFVFVDVDQTMEPKFCWSVSKFKIFKDESFEWTRKKISSVL